MSPPHQKCRKSRRRLPAGACVYPRYPCRRSCGGDILGDLSIALTSTAAANAPGWPMCAPDARRAHVVVKNTNFDAHWLTASGLFAGVARLGVGRRRPGSSPGPGAVCPYCRCAELGQSLLVFQFQFQSGKLHFGLKLDCKMASLLVVSIQYSASADCTSCNRKCNRKCNPGGGNGGGRAGHLWGRSESGLSSRAVAQGPTPPSSPRGRR